MKKIHIIIPMGGLGTRFINKYPAPKPLIMLKGKPLFVRAALSITEKIVYETITFVVREEHIEKYKIDDIIHTYFPNANVVKLTRNTAGAAETVLTGVNYLLENGLANNNDGLLTMDCDLQYITSNPVLSNEDLDNCEGILYSFKSTDPKYSFVIIDGVDYSAVATFEKDNSYTDNAITAPYYINSLSDFINAYHLLVNDLDHTGELYMSNIYNKLLSMNKYIRVSIDTETVGFGTPEELEEALNKL